MKEWVVKHECRVLFEKVLSEGSQVGFLFGDPSRYASTHPEWVVYNRFET